MIHNTDPSTSNGAPRRTYSAFHAFTLSLYSVDFYRDVARNWRGICLGLLAGIIVFGWVLMTVRWQLDYHHWLAQDMPVIAKQLPNITIRDGNLHIDKPVPYTITPPKQTTPLLVIDTSGQITSLKQTPATILLTKNQIYVRDINSDQVRSMTYRDIEKHIGRSITFNRETFTVFMEKTRFLPLLGFLGAVPAFIWRLLWVMLFALLGYIIADFKDIKIDFSGLVRLSVVTMVPRYTVDLFLTLTAAPSHPAVSALLNLLYLIAGVILMIRATNAQRENLI